MRGFVFIPPGFRLMSRLAFGPRKPRRPILGTAIAGEVAALGRDVRRFKEGDPVFGLDSTTLGAYAEYACRPANGPLALKPASVSYAEAAATPFGATTALYFLHDRAQIQSGQRLLVRGASGGVGVYAVQLGAHAGAEITGVCSTGNLDLVRSLGAGHVIDYTQEDFTANGETYDLILDLVVGKTSFARCRGSLTEKGLYLAAAGGPREMLQSAWTALRGGPKVVAGTPAESKEALIAVKELLEAGAIRAVVDRRYPLEQIVEAHRAVDHGLKRGSVVIDVDRADAT